MVQPYFFCSYIYILSKTTITIPINALQTSTNVILLTIFITAVLGSTILRIKVAIAVHKMFTPNQIYIFG